MGRAFRVIPGTGLKEMIGDMKKEWGRENKDSGVGHLEEDAKLSQFPLVFSDGMGSI